MDHLPRFVVFIPIKDKAARTTVRHLIECVFSVFGPPEAFHSDQRKEFESYLVKELQSVFGYKKTRAAAFRPQGNSVLERVHSTVHNMLAMYRLVQIERPKLCPRPVTNAIPNQQIWYRRKAREKICLLYTSPSPRDLSTSRMPSSA